MSKNIDVFRVHDLIMDDSKSFVSSLLNIRDERIRIEVEQQMAAGRFWPEPLLPFNPGYAPSMYPVSSSRRISIEGSNASDPDTATRIGPPSEEHGRSSSRI